MRIVVLGADGMLGHALTAAGVGAGLAVTAVTRRAEAPLGEAASELTHVGGCDVRLVRDVAYVLAEARPDVIVNCAGVVKSRRVAQADLVAVNALFPHELASLARLAGARLIHLSTDCVFSGASGRYTEDSVPDPVDAYGASKLLGEVTGRDVLTLRTSMVGLELGRSNGLVEWYLAQQAPVAGWSRAFFSGFTTAELSRLLVRIIVDHPGVAGIWHASAEPISKYDLLQQLRLRLGTTAEIVEDAGVAIDRSLDSSRFRAETGYAPPPWQRMIDELATEVARRRGSADE